jgi:hypothetical protein
VKWKNEALPLAKLVEAMMDSFSLPVLASELKFTISLGEDLQMVADQPG